MSEFLKANQIKEQISLLELIRNLGYNPVKTSGGEHFFISMLRGEKTASLCVNDALNVWFDHGGPGKSGIKSGTIIDFALAFWFPCTFPEALKNILNACKHPIAELSQSRDKHRDRSPVKLPNYRIEAIQEIGSNASINAFLQYRGIWGVADKYISEVYYYVLDEHKRQKNFFASGWKNENNGWEVRNKYFKGCLGKKGLSFFEQDSKRLAIFEGYFDFLSWKFENEENDSSVIVLNSLSFLQAAINRSSVYSEVEIYFDHDSAGRQATDTFISHRPNSIDSSALYSGFKDYNEKLMYELNLLRTAKKGMGFER